MKIAILSCFYPYRGGISQFNANIFDELGKSHTVKAFNFTRQYPDFLFPGKTQYVTKDDEAVPVESEALLDTANPFTWISAAKKIAAWEPDLLIMRYWMSWFGPSLGFVARHLKKKCKVVAILDNVIPHEPRIIDKPFTKYFLGGCTGYVTMCKEVTDDLLRLKPDARYMVHPHPLYSHFGEKIGRIEAEDALGIPHGRKNILFFGLIRQYKGLDILLEAFSRLPEDYQLIVAGEPYGSFDKYQEIIDGSGAKDRIFLYPQYIRDSEVKKYFSAADVTVLPYRSATQSGISSVSYHFEVPMIVTDVGGLKEAIGDTGTGLVSEKPDPAYILRDIERYFIDDSLRNSCIENIRKEKQRLSWKAFCDDLVSFQNEL